MLRNYRKKIETSIILWFSQINIHRSRGTRDQLATMLATPRVRLAVTFFFSTQYAHVSYLRSSRLALHKTISADITGSISYKISDIVNRKLRRFYLIQSHEDENIQW